MTYDHHPACRCGCGELADECPRGTWAYTLGERDSLLPCFSPEDDRDEWSM